MSCQHIKALFPDFLIGDLDGDEKSRIQAHIAGCSSCREELESLSAIWTKLGVLPAEQPSANLRTRFYSMLENQKVKDRIKARKPGIRNRLQTFLRGGPAFRPAFQLPLAVIFLLIGIAAGSLFSIQKGRSGEMAQLQQDVKAMRQTLAFSLLEKPSAVDRLQGINLSCNVEEPDSSLLEALIETVNTDPNVNVRLAAVDSLYLFYDSPIIQQGITGLLSRQTSPLVQIALIDLIVNMQERRAVESLRELVQNQTLHPDVKSRAELGLQKIGM